MRLIDADKVIDTMTETLEVLKKMFPPGDQERHLIAAIDTCGQMVNDAPTIDASPVVHGEWEDDDILKESRCSACGEVSSWFDSDIEYWNYCPYCGAKMDGGKDNE